MLESRTRLEPPRWSAAGSIALSRGCPMKHVSAVLVIAALFVVAASGRAQVQQGGPTPSAPPADAPLSRLFHRIPSVPQCRRRTRCDALRAGALRGRAIA